METILFFFIGFHIRFFRSYIRKKMGDSDDDFDSRRNRDKFRRERDDFGGNRGSNNRGGGGEWNDGR